MFDRITKSFVDFNGVVPEKFDVVNLSHQVQVEYGNVGLDFKFIPREGFGWMNTSFEVGLTYLNVQMLRALGTLTDPDFLFKKVVENETENLSDEEKREAMYRRRVSTIAAREILSHEADAVVTKINKDDIIRQSVSVPKSPDAYQNFLPPHAEDVREGDSELFPVPNTYGDFLDPSTAERK